MVGDTQQGITEHLENLLADREQAEDIIKLLNTYLSLSPGKEKGESRDRLTLQFWQLFAAVVEDITTGNLSTEAKRFLRFGLLDNRAVSADKMEKYLELETERPSDSQIYYLDEWLEAVFTGDIPVSAADETLREKQETPDFGNMALQTERLTVRQMIRLCVGRRGNHTPYLLDEAVRIHPLEGLNSREKVENYIDEIEGLCDPTIFFRSFGGEMYYVRPRILLVPGYGNFGICWEPWERQGKKDKPGRIILPIHCAKSPKMTILYALADYRWEIAKAHAMHYWMEEGLTGEYYIRYGNVRGVDIKEKFIQDYLLWIIKESDGRPKLDKKTRAFFWRTIPFNEEIKSKLETHAAFKPLFEADQRRQTSRFASISGKPSSDKKDTPRSQSIQRALLQFRRKKDSAD